MTEYGLFNDEGLIEGQFYSKDEAELAKLDRYTPDDELYVDIVKDEENEEDEE